MGIYYVVWEWSDNVLKWSDNVLEWHDNVLEWSDNVLEWRDNVLEWHDNVLEWRDNVLEWSDNTWARVMHALPRAWNTRDLLRLATSVVLFFGGGHMRNRSDLVDKKHNRKS